MVNANTKLIENVIGAIKAGDSSKAVSFMQQSNLFKLELAPQLSDLGTNSRAITRLMEMPFKLAAMDQENTTIKANSYQLLEQLLDVQTARVTNCLESVSSVELSKEDVARPRHLVKIITGYVKQAIKDLQNSLEQHEESLPYRETFELELLIIGLYYLEGLVRIEKNQHLSDTSNPYLFFEHKSDLHKQLIGNSMAETMQGNLNAVMYPSPIPAMYLRLLIESVPLTFQNLLKDMNQELYELGMLTAPDSILAKKQQESTDIEGLVEAVNAISLSENMIFVREEPCERLAELEKVLSDVMAACKIFEKNKYKQGARQDSLTLSFHLHRLLYLQNGPNEYLPRQTLISHLKKLQKNTALMKELSQLGELGWIVIYRYSQDDQSIAPKQLETIIKNLRYLLEHNDNQEYQRIEFTRLLGIMIASNNFKFADLNFLFDSKNQNYLQLFKQYDYGTIAYAYGNSEPLLLRDVNDLQNRLLQLNETIRRGLPLDEVTTMIIKRYLYNLEVAKAGTIVKYGTSPLTLTCIEVIKRVIVEVIADDHSNDSINPALPGRSSP